LEPDGLHFYRIADAIGDKEECGAVVEGERPQLIPARDGALLLVANGRESPLDAPLWQLYRSDDGAESFSLLSALPEPELEANKSIAAVLAGLRPDGLIVAVYAIAGRSLLVDAGYIAVSGDGGATWGEPEAFQNIQSLLPAFLKPADVYGRIGLWGVGTAAANVPFATPDFGATWELLRDTFIPNPPDSGATSHNIRGGFLWRPDGFLMQLSSSTSNRDVWATFTHDAQGEWYYSEIAELVPGYAKLVQLPDGFIRATNGRDWQYETRDGGATWSVL
jgi:hypothetical protein